jgi:hypothetical protein
MTLLNIDIPYLTKKLQDLLKIPKPDRLYGRNRKACFQGA